MHTQLHKDVQHERKIVHKVRPKAFSETTEVVPKVGHEVGQSVHIVSTKLKKFQNARNNWFLTFLGSPPACTNGVKLPSKMSTKLSTDLHTKLSTELYTKWEPIFDKVVH